MRGVAREIGFALLSSSVSHASDRVAHSRFLVCLRCCAFLVGLFGLCCYAPGQEGRAALRFVRCYEYRMRMSSEEGSARITLVAHLVGLVRSQRLGLLTALPCAMHHARF